MEYRLEGGGKRDRGFVGNVGSCGSISFEFFQLGKCLGCEKKGDELTDFVKPFLSHFLSNILPQIFCAHYNTAITLEASPLFTVPPALYFVRVPYL